MKINHGSVGKCEMVHLIGAIDNTLFDRVLEIINSTKNSRIVLNMEYVTTWSSRALEDLSFIQTICHKSGGNLVIVNAYAEQASDIQRIFRGEIEVFNSLLQAENYFIEL